MSKTSIDKRILMILSSQYGSYSRPVARAIGIKSAVMLHEIIGKLEYNLTHSPGSLMYIEGKPYFFYTHEMGESRLGMSRKEQDNALTELMNLGVISKVLKGIPPRRYLCLNQNEMIEFLNRINSAEDNNELETEEDTSQAASAKLSKRDNTYCPEGAILYKEIMKPNIKPNIVCTAGAVSLRSARPAGLEKSCFDSAEEAIPSQEMAKLLRKEAAEDSDDDPVATEKNIHVAMEDASIPWKISVMRESVEVFITQSDLYTYVSWLKEDWKCSEIKSAWKILDEYPGKVYDWRKFIHGTLKNLRKKAVAAKINQKRQQTTGSKSCSISSQNNSQTTSSKDSNRDSSEKGSEVQPSPESPSLMDSLKKLLHGSNPGLLP